MKFITGANGRIGNVLVKELNKRGEKVKIFVRRESDLSSLEGCKYEISYGDIKDIDSLRNAISEGDEVFHLAGFINISDYNEKKTFDINVAGTENIIKVCLEKNVKRLLHTSSIHAFSIQNEEVINEQTPLCNKEKRGIYDVTKAKATCGILEAVRKSNLNAVVVCPTGVIGPYDYRPSFFGKAMISSVKTGLRATVEGAYDYVDVRDVALGMILAFEKGRAGEVYILGGERITMKEYFDFLKELTGIKTETRTISKGLAMVYAKVKSFFDRKSDITPYSLETLLSNSNISHEKATRELGYKPRSVKESLKDQYEWFLKRGMIK